MEHDAGDWDAGAWTAAFADGRARPRDAVLRCLGRIDRYDSQLGVCNEVVPRTRLLEQADASAERWRRGTPLSPLDGIPFGVKANIAIKGLSWHAGIAAFRDRRAPEDAACVARLRAAGLIPLAILNMHEAALGATSDNPAFRTTRNPHDPRHIPGGSSGGSAAAVAAGMALLALGSDSLGSVRLPSALCGVVGFKPAGGDIPLAGMVPLCTRLDQIGVHGRSVDDIAAAMAVLAPESGWNRHAASGPELAEGPHPANGLDAATSLNLAHGPDQPSRPNPVGWPERAADWRVAIGQQFARPISEAHARLLAAHGVTDCVDWSDVDLSAVRRAGLLLCERDAARRFSVALRECADGFSPEFRRLAEWGAAQSAAKVGRAERLLAEVSRRLRDDLESTLLLSPTTPYLAPRLGVPPPVALADLTAPAAIAGVAAISVPTAVGGRGLPMGLHIAGLAGNQVLDAARVLFPGVAGMQTDALPVETCGRGL